MEIVILPLFNIKDLLIQICIVTIKIIFVGIDLGLKTYATQSDGKIAKFPKRKILKLEKKIEKIQRILSHKRLLHEKKYGKKLMNMMGMK